MIEGFLGMNRAPAVARVVQPATPRNKLYRSAGQNHIKRGWGSISPTDHWGSQTRLRVFRQL